MHVFEPSSSRTRVDDTYQAKHEVLPYWSRGARMHYYCQASSYLRSPGAVRAHRSCLTAPGPWYGDSIDRISDVITSRYT
jgi:hypothetical protein